MLEESQKKEQNELEAPEVRKMKSIISHLQLFMPITLARRLVSIILQLAGVPTQRITELTGLSDRTVRGQKKLVHETEDMGSLLTIKEGNGRKSKLVNIEDQVVAELEKGNFHSQQQIADMIKKTFHITISRAAVGQFLKKRE